MSNLDQSDRDGAGDLGHEQVISREAAGAYSVFAADVDGDGDIDVLSASTSDDTIAWYENVDRHGSFGPPRVISTTASAATSVFSADMDNDGDVDVLSASFNDDKIAWYKNVDGAGNVSPETVISATAAGAQSVFAADLNGDHRIDVISASFNDNKIAWYENGSGGGGDGVGDVCDNWPEIANPGQEDSDGDGVRDACQAAAAALLTSPAPAQKLGGRGTPGR